MKYLVALFAWSMPVVAWLSNTGVFGPANGEISDRFPTLIVAAGYAFSIWGLIFLLDLVYGTWQLFDRSVDGRARALGPCIALGFALTSAWMIVFSLQCFWLALAIIWTSLGCLWYAAWRFSQGVLHAAARWWQRVPLSLRAGWVSLAAFLNIAQVIVAFRLLSTTQMLGWTLVLFALAALLLLASVAVMRGNPWYALAAAWGLVGVYVKQSHAGLAGAGVASGVAIASAALVVAWTAVILLRRQSAPRRRSAA